MKLTLIAIAASVAWLTASHASAQAIEGFVTGGTHRDSNREQFTGLGGGVLLTGGKWIGVGAQGDAFFSLPYVAGRFTMLVQGNVFDISTRGAGNRTPYSVDQPLRRSSRIRARA
jgi:hypothetical protein